MQGKPTVTEGVATLDEAIGVGERLYPSDRLRLIGILSELSGSELEQGIEPIDMLSLAGLGAEVWRDLDLPTYLEQERQLGQLGETLARHDIADVDTSPFIYLWEQHPRYLPLAEELFLHLRRSQVQGITLVITLIEACTHPQRQGRLDLVQAYENSLLHSQQIRMLPVDATLAPRAVTLRAAYEIHVPDALQIAGAIVSGATLFVTNDRRLSKVQEIEILLFEDHLQ